MMTTLALALSLMATPQDQDKILQMPPTQLNDLQFMMGTWEGKGTATGPDGKTAQIDGSATVSMQLDRWIQWDTTDEIPGQGMMTGRFMLTYNPMKSVWQGVWFDNQSSFPTNFTGNFANGTLTMSSEPVPNMDGVGTSVYTVTYTKLSDMEIGFKMESNMGARNAPLIDYVYSKR